MPQSDLRARTQQAARPAEQANLPATSEAPTLTQRVQQLADRGVFASALPKHVTPDRMTRIVLTALRKNPALERCTPDSFLGAVLTAAQLGLEVNTPAAEAYLVPYGREATLIVGYQGYAKLFWQSNDAKHLDAQVVYENDDFDYAYGLDPYLRHKPAQGDRGKVKCFYAVATLRSGGRAFVVLTPEEVDALRDTRRRQDVRDPQHWMARKTCIRQVLKLMPKSPELSAALVADDQVRTDYGPIEALSVRLPEADLAPVPADAEVVNPTTGQVGTPDEVAWPAPARPGVEVAEPEDFGGNS